MSFFSSQQSGRSALHMARRGGPRRNGSAAASKKTTDEREWDELVAREAMHQEVIDASFDRAEAHGRLGDFEQALNWLDRAAGLSGGLPPAYQAKRARWVRAGARRVRPAAGDWRNRSADPDTRAGT
jgi:hypothetical protein